MQQSAALEQERLMLMVLEPFWYLDEQKQQDLPTMQLHAPRRPFHE